MDKSIIALASQEAVRSLGIEAGLAAAKEAASGVSVNAFATAQALADKAYTLSGTAERRAAAFDVGGEAAAEAFKAARLAADAHKDDAAWPAFRAARSVCYGALSLGVYEVGASKGDLGKAIKAAKLTRRAEAAGDASALFGDLIGAPTGDAVEAMRREAIKAAEAAMLAAKAEAEAKGMAAKAEAKAKAAEARAEAAEAKAEAMQTIAAKAEASMEANEATGRMKAANAEAIAMVHRLAAENEALKADIALMAEAIKAKDAAIKAAIKAKAAKAA